LYAAIKLQLQVSCGMWKALLDFYNAVVKRQMTVTIFNHNTTSTQNLLQKACWQHVNCLTLSREMTYMQDVFHAAIYGR